MYESECKALLERYAACRARKNPHPAAENETGIGQPLSVEKSRFPLLGAYDLCLKCSHLFNILDARGAISVTERVGVIARVRALAVGIAKAWVDQQRGEATAGNKSEEEEPVSKKKVKAKKEKLSTVRL